VKGTPRQLAINLHVLRSLTRAEYSPLHIGHYALASEHYCHFTSPIRRYADLLVHRLLEHYIRGKLHKGAADVPSEAELIEIGKHLSFTEQRADDAENELKNVLILQMLSERVGETLDCVVTGLTNFGIFVQSQRFGIEGLIPLEQLGEDQWRYDDRVHAVVGARSGRTIHLGEPMAARIVSVNIAARQLNLVPEQEMSTKPEGKVKKSKYAEARAGRRSERQKKMSREIKPGARKGRRGRRG
jgi:ribonuclease R